VPEPVKPASWKAIPKMTFVLGMMCSDGIVICADRMETDGYSVRFRRKLEGENVGGEWGVLWGGSGPSDAVDKFSDLFRQRLGNDSFDKVGIEKKAEGCLKAVKTNYSDQLIKVVVGVFGMPLIKPNKAAPYLGHLEQILYRGNSDSCCLSPEREWCCAGMDDTLTKFLMDSLFHRAMHISEAQELSICVTSLMKKYAGAWVGGPTDVAFFTPGFTGWLEMMQSRITPIEKTFSAADVTTLMRYYWAQHHPQTWSERKHKHDTDKLLRKLKRSASRKKADQQ
jgi:hypothetical protein